MKHLNPKYRGLVVATAALVMTIGSWLGAAPGPLGLACDLINHFAPLWLVLGAVMVIAASVRRGAWSAARVAVLVCGGLWAGSQLWLMAPDIAGRLSPRPAEPVAVRVMTYNLWNQNRDADATVRAILTSSADVIAFPEPRWGHADSVLDRVKGAYPYQMSCLENRWCNLAIVSRRPFLSSGYHQGDWAGADPDLLNLAWGVTTDRQGRPFTIAVTHHVWPSPDGLQEAQARQLAAALDRCGFQGLVLAGDFNATPWSYILKRQDRRLRPLRRLSNLTPSWPNHMALANGRFAFPFLPIDHLYAAPEWRRLDLRRVDGGGSDHYALVADLSRASTVLRDLGAPAGPPACVERGRS